MNIKELRSDNIVLHEGKVIVVDSIDGIREEINMPDNDWESGIKIKDLKPIPITPETVEKFIDWQFEFGFNKSIVEKEYWIETHYLMENVIEGSSDFEIVFGENKIYEDLNEIQYYVDNNLLEFGLDNDFHNLQNLFYIVSGSELPIKKILN